MQCHECPVMCATSTFFSLDHKKMNRLSRIGLFLLGPSSIPSSSYSFAFLAFWVVIN